MKIALISIIIFGFNKYNFDWLFSESKLSEIVNI